MKLPLGRLERVGLRDYWSDEARDFTPWLAQPENVALLAEAVGLDLEVDSQEKSVGPFRADILCKDTTSGHLILIENQIERTDHTHLGQLMTYAAGLEAVTVVWIASRFTEEHRAALDWLNNITNESFNFFGLEIELWRIGESSIAPKFNVVSKPNDWSKAVRQTAVTGSGHLTEFQQLHFDFWTQLRRLMEERQSPVRINKPSADSWTTVAVGRANFAIFLVNGMRDGYSNLYLAMTGPPAKHNFRLIKERFKDQIEQNLGALEWRELPEAKESQIRLVQKSTPTNRDSWPELLLWFAEHVEAWVTVLRPLVKSFDTLEPG